MLIRNKQYVDYDAIENIVSASRHLYDAGEEDAAIKILQDMKEKLITGGGASEPRCRKRNRRV